MRGSIDTTLKESDTDKPMVEIVEHRPAATFDLDPAEYRRIREELEQEREQATGFYHDPENFWKLGSEGSIWD